MAITTNAICNTFKEEILEGVHDFTPTTGDVFKLALYTNSATIGADTTAYPGDSTGGQVSNTGQYAQGGGALVNALVSNNGGTAFVDFSDLSFTIQNYRENMYNILDEIYQGHTDENATSKYKLSYKDIGAMSYRA